MNWPWNELGLPGPSDLTEIRRAYALRLKDCHPEEDPDGFQRLHSAYQAACRAARQNLHPRKEPEPEKTAPQPWRFPAREDDFQETDGSQEPDGAQPQEADWDYEELFQGQEPAGPEPEELDWDYDRLFAEGEAEAQEARRRKLEELRRKNRDRYAAQEEEQRRRSNDEQAAWEAVMAAAQALELLHATGAPLAEWRKFLGCAVFWNVRGNLDFVFTLEDFIEQNPELSQDIRRAIFEAYGFEKGVNRPEYRRLYHLLGIGRREKHRMRRKYRPQETAGKRAARIFSVVLLGLLIVGGVGSVLVGAVKEISGKFASVSWEEQCLEWLEVDLERDFIRPFPDKSFRYSEKDDPEDEDYVKACIYAPADSPDEYFFAYQDGERDLERGNLGYQSNYADRLLMTALSSLAEEWEYELDYDSANGGYNQNLGETPGAYMFQLPLAGAGEFITALGELLAELETEKWYQENPPEYEVFLCYGQVHFYSNLSTRGEFDTDYARSIYENKWGPNICRFLAKETGAAAEDLGEDAYVLIERGTVLVDGNTYFWVSAMEKPPSKTELAHYLLSESGTVLYCITPEMMDNGFSQADLLRCGMELRRVEELGEHRMIIVRDHFK
ncbi:MAG: hypothetical protein HFF84_15405 [Oscillibacter sp.]|nr:hypothetical protein [Oscillibacter sp.]